MPPKHDKFFGTPLPGVDMSELTGKLIILEGADGSGRSTQMVRLKKWLEVEGHGVINTGWTQSPLMQPSIDAAKEGNTLSKMTFSLFYLADFADRLENVILPALKHGFIVLADRYVYTAFVRNAVRGIDRKWTRDVYSFAVKPDLVCYLRTDVEQLITRMLKSKGLEYWESGMDLHLGEDLYDSFLEYQSRVLEEFDEISDQYGFKVIDGAGEPSVIFNELKREISAIL